MRIIENEINNKCWGVGKHQKSEIPLTNFRGIELRDFPAEIARLALIIAEYQCDVLYRGQKDALAEFLPLNAKNWITCGNALRLDWLSICPPTGKAVKLVADDLLGTPLEQAEIDFENEGGETYICGNPPYLGSTWQSKEQKSDLERIFKGRTKSWKSLDYVAGWFMKAADYGTRTDASSAFVSTNSICQGQQVPILWPLVFNSGHEISFAHTSFKWANLASHNAGVTVVVIGISSNASTLRNLFTEDHDGEISVRKGENISPYLVICNNTIVNKKPAPLDMRFPMVAGGKPVEGGNLLLNESEYSSLISLNADLFPLFKRVYGASEYIKGVVRYCLWITEENMSLAHSEVQITLRLEKVAKLREKSPKPATRSRAETPHKFEETKQSGSESVIIVPKVSSERRRYLPAGYLPIGSIVTDLAFAIFDAPLWNLSLLTSRIHLVWIATVCGKMKTDFRYSNTLGWNTFPVPKLTEKNKEDLTRCAENILLARETHFPATIADLYNPENMPENLRHAHERNDEVLERIYIGRRFKNDTERLEKLFNLYTKMITDSNKTSKTKKKVS